MTLAIVDDDEDVRRALARLLRSLGHDVHVFGSAEEFEARPWPSIASFSMCACLVSAAPSCANGCAAARPRLRRPHHR